MVPRSRALRIDSDCPIINEFSKNSRQYAESRYVSGLTSGIVKMAVLNQFVPKINTFYPPLPIRIGRPKYNPGICRQRATGKLQIPGYRCPVQWIIGVIVKPRIRPFSLFQFELCFCISPHLCIGSAGIDIDKTWAVQFFPRFTFCKLQYAILPRLKWQA